MDKKATQDLIEKYIPMVHWVARRYYYRFPYLYEDFIAEGCLALCNAANSSDYDPSISTTSYFLQAIRRSCQRLVHNEIKRLQSIPLFEFKEFEDEDDAPGYTWEDAVPIDAMHQDTQSQDTIVKDFMLWLRRRSEADYQLVFHLYSNYTFAETAFRLKLGLPGMISYHLKRIQNYWREYNGKR